jgi:hypothetical protein
MRNKGLIIAAILFFTCSQMQAQQAYRGGSGDGYASATAKNITLDINGDVQKAGIEFLVFPNPATENTAITLDIEERDCQLSIYCVEGKLMHTFPVNNSRIKLPALPPGTYLLKAENEDAFSIQKMIVLPAE